MNSLDIYDFTEPGQPNGPSNVDASSSSSLSTATEETSQPSLNEEVTQVIGQLGRFWGGVRKQSQTAFELARKDIGQVVSQAQKELERMGGQNPEVREGEHDPFSTEISDEKPSDHNNVVLEETSINSIAGPSTESPPINASASSSFLSRLQGSLPPNFTPSALSSTLQRHLPENLQHGLNLENATADFTQLRTALAENIQRVQGTTVQQAEKLAEQYMHKGEALFKDAGEFLKDAVKVVPPEGGSGVAGVVWDGTDLWTMPSPIQTNVGRATSKKGKNKESDVIFSVPRAAAKRADILLKSLRSDPEALLKDPGKDDDAAVKQLWSSFVTDEVDGKGGIAGETWTARVSVALEGHDENEDAKSLAVLRDQLVPAEMSNDVFWTRYFFRVHQIEQEKERRKALLERANQDDDDFTWEDDDEVQGGDEQLSSSQAENDTPVNTSSGTANNQVPATSDTPKPLSMPPSNPSSSTSQTPVCISPRESEDSYDVVSSENVSSTGGRAGERKTKGGEKGGDDGDESDWE
ncbi:hypothetical protein JB92DRAFT_3138317 [Gautieria morchelliformis]|nr:hypothetical protein JB92DRAFT_3138317 [Gautieria morchelliformis]